MGNKCDSLFKLIKDADNIIKFKKKYKKKLNKISNNINPQEYTYKNYNLLHYASKKGRTSVIFFLLEQDFDINRQMINGYTPLLCALEGKHIQTSLFLMDSGSDVNVITADSITSLMLASKIPSIECVKRILETYNISINISTLKEGYIALTYSVESESNDICLLLIENGSDILHITKSGETLLDISRRTDNEELVSFFTKYIDENNCNSNGNGNEKRVEIPHLKFLSLKQSSGEIHSERIQIDNQIDSIGNFTVHDSEVSRTPRSPVPDIKKITKNDRYPDVSPIFSHHSINPIVPSVYKNAEIEDEIEDDEDEEDDNANDFNE